MGPVEPGPRSPLENLGYAYFVGMNPRFRKIGFRGVCNFFIKGPAEPYVQQSAFHDDKSLFCEFWLHSVFASCFFATG